MLLCPWNSSAPSIIVSPSCIAQLRRSVSRSAAAAKSSSRERSQSERISQLLFCCPQLACATVEEMMAKASRLSNVATISCFHSFRNRMHGKNERQACSDTATYFKIRYKIVHPSAACTRSVIPLVLSSLLIPIVSAVS